MKNFPRALAFVIGQNGWTQYGLGKKCGLLRSKMNRLVHEKIACSRDDLGRILSAIPDETQRYKLVLNYLMDELPPNALTSIAFAPVSTTPRDSTSLDLWDLTPNAIECLRYMAAHHRPVLEDVVPAIAQTIGWKPSKPSRKPRANKPVPAIERP